MLWRSSPSPRILSCCSLPFNSLNWRIRRISNVRCVELFFPATGSTSHEDQEVKINGFVRSVRRQKRVAFAQISDGSTVQSLQAILSPEQVADLSTGTSIEIQGIWKKSPAKGQTHELQTTHVKVIGGVDPQEYPIQKKYHTPEFLRSIPHLRFRTPINSQLLRFRSETVFAITDFFRRRQSYGPFYQVQPPLITSSDCEGAGEVFTLAPKELSGKGEHFFKDPKYLTVSSQLHLEAFAAELGSVWTLSPTFRAERSDTPRHLAEFYMLEVELNLVTELQDVMTLVEDMIRHIVTKLKDSIIGREMLSMKQQLETAGTDGLTDGNDREPENLVDRWHALTQPASWETISYTKAINHLQESAPKDLFRHAPSWDFGLQLEHEKWLVQNLGKGGPLFITDYPKAIKPFYMLPSYAQPNLLSEDGKETVSNFDLLFPHVAEVVGGSLREHRLSNLIGNMREHGFLHQSKANVGNLGRSDSSTYPHLHPNETIGSMEWYADLRRYGSTPHGGFGLGFDRLLAYLTGIPNIKDVVGFPRYWGRADC